MRVAALFDVHGNVPALAAVLEDELFARADVVVVGGDVVAGPDPAGALERLQALDDRVLFLRGNADREVVSPEESGRVADIAAWSRERLTSAQLNRVAAWPATAELDVPGLGRVLFCHATPGSDTELVTRVTPDDAVRAILDVCEETDVVVCGHVHVRYDRRVAGGPRVVNPGSVGMPYEGSPGAYWALLGPAVELCRTEYDVDAAVAAMRRAGYPGVDDLETSSLRGGVTPDEATAYFESRRGS